MDLQATLQKEISVFQQLQKDVEKSVKNRTKLESQLKENEGVNREFQILEKEGENEIFKLIGPVLVKQDKNEAVNNVKKRIEFINTEIKRSESVISDLQERMEKKKLEIVKLETAVQQMQPQKTSA